MNKFEGKYFFTAKRMDEAFLEILENKDFEFITVKEICAKAGVNRSTFYLHYESLNDLLLEAGEYIVQKYAEYFDGEIKSLPDIKEVSLEQLCFINADYLTPWLTYILDNKNLFRTLIKRSKTLGMEESYQDLFGEIIQPILNRFHVKSEDQEYMFAFYVEGIIAIVKMWIKDDCQRPIEEIVEIIKGCIRTYEA